MIQLKTKRQIPRIPKMIYGTTWKQEFTKELTIKAVLAGFDAIDTANQKKHYREDYVGDALRELKARGVERQSLFLLLNQALLRLQQLFSHCHPLSSLLLFLQICISVLPLQLLFLEDLT